MCAQVKNQRWANRSKKSVNANTVGRMFLVQSRKTDERFSIHLKRNSLRNWARFERSVLKSLTELNGRVTLFTTWRFYPLRCKIPSLQGIQAHCDFRALACLGNKIPKRRKGNVFTEVASVQQTRTINFARTRVDDLASTEARNHRPFTNKPQWIVRVKHSCLYQARHTRGQSRKCLMSTRFCHLTSLEAKLRFEKPGVKQRTRSIHATSAHECSLWDEERENLKRSTSHPNISGWRV